MNYTTSMKYTFVEFISKKAKATFKAVFKSCLQVIPNQILELIKSGVIGLFYSR